MKLLLVLLNNASFQLFAYWVIFHAFVVVKITLKNSFSNTIRVSNGLDPDQDRHFVTPDLGSNCLQRLLENNQGKFKLNKLLVLIS